MVGKHILGALCALDGLPCHLGLGPIGTNDETRTQTGVVSRSVTWVADVHPRHAIRVARDFGEGAAHAGGTVRTGTFTQPLVKAVTVDHAHKAVFNRDVNFVVARGNHARATCFGNQQMVWNFKVFDQTRWNGTTTWFGAALTVQQQHLPTTQRQIIGRCGPGWTAADDDNVISVCVHESTPV